MKGLCDSCLYAHRVQSKRGSSYVRCRKSKEDPAFPKYPHLPVLECRGFEQKPDE